MFAVYKKEMRSYFATPIGYIFIGIFLALAGALFSFCTIQKLEESDTALYFNLMLYAFVIIIPLLTMKSFSDERKQRTEQLLLTSPIKLSAMVGAKFLAAYTMFALTFLVSCLNFLLLGKYGTPSGGILFGNIISILLVGAAFIAVGIFVSSLTESQLVAAFGTIGILLLLLLVSLANQFIDTEFIRVILSWISIFSRFQQFTYGQFSFASIVYYASIAFIFLFLTVRVYEKRRWD